MVLGTDRVLTEDCAKDAGAMISVFGWLLGNALKH